MFDRGIEIAVCRNISATAGISLANATTAMNEHLIEAALVWLIRILVTEMPFAEDAGRVAGGLEHLRERHSRQTHTLALENRVGDSALELVGSGHQCATGWRAGRADVKIREADSFIVHPIHLRRLHNGVTGAGKIPVTLIVVEDDNDVGPHHQGRGTGRVKIRPNRELQAGDKCERRAQESNRHLELTGFCFHLSCVSAWP